MTEVNVDSTLVAVKSARAVAGRRAPILGIVLLGLLAVAGGPAFLAGAQASPLAVPSKPLARRHAKPLKQLPSVTGGTSRPAPAARATSVSPYARAAARQSESRAAAARHPQIQPVAPTVPSQRAPQ